LIGVDQGYRGEQIGTKLINQALSYFKKTGKFEVQVVTQKANVLACNFYTKNGFHLVNTINVYHLWI
jgi:dTDP-4-amino-4,6-dideoxy-D-galactose acyltransferase